MQDQGTQGRDADRERVDVEPFEVRSPDLEGRDTSMDPESMTLEDWVEAENARPTLPDENADGLDPMEEEVRRQAEDVDTPENIDDAGS